MPWTGVEVPASGGISRYMTSVSYRYGEELGTRRDIPGSVIGKYDIYCTAIMLSSACGQDFCSEEGYQLVITIGKEILGP